VHSVGCWRSASREDHRLLIQRVHTLERQVRFCKDRVCPGFAGFLRTAGRYNQAALGLGMRLDSPSGCLRVEQNKEDYCRRSH
jgi:hypothetical protein